MKYKLSIDNQGLLRLAIKGVQFYTGGEMNRNILTPFENLENPQKGGWKSAAGSIEATPEEIKLLLKDIIQNILTLYPDAKITRQQLFALQEEKINGRFFQQSRDNDKLYFSSFLSKVLPVFFRIVNNKEEEITGRETIGKYNYICEIVFQVYPDKETGLEKVTGQLIKAVGYEETTHTRKEYTSQPGFLDEFINEYKTAPATNKPDKTQEQPAIEIADDDDLPF